VLHCDCGGAIVGCSVGVDVVGSLVGLAGFVFIVIVGGHCGLQLGWRWGLLRVEDCVAL